MNSLKRSASVSGAYQPPRAAGRSSGSKKGDNKKAASSSTTLSSITVSLPGSDDESPTKPPASISTPTNTERPNLRLPDSAYKILTGFTDKIDSLLRQRQSLIRTHEVMVRQVNRGEVPRVTSVRSLPSLQGVAFSETFKTQYQSKCNQYGIKLAVLLLNEYRTMIDGLQSDVNLVITECEDALATFEDNTVRSKAIELLHVKHKASIRRLNQDRRQIRARRRLHRS